ncbi:transposase [Bacillus thuringiensis]
MFTNQFKLFTRNITCIIVYHRKHPFLYRVYHRFQTGSKEALDKVTNILCDGGYTGPSFAQSIKETIDCSVEVIKRSELHKFVVLPKRWIVERTFAWLENYRRLWKNCERTLENSRQSCLLAGVAILLKRF